jgi:hypothetical protein
MVSASTADAGSRPSLSLAQARQVTAQIAHKSLIPNEGGHAVVTACHRLKVWKVGCSENSIYDDGSICTTVFYVANSTVADGYYHRILTSSRASCTVTPTYTTPTAPTYTTPTAPSYTTPAAPTLPEYPAVVPPPTTYPTELPQNIGQSVSSAYVGGMINRAHASSGGVSYCNLPVGFSVTCAYRFSGIENDGATFYTCTGFLTISGVYLGTGWQTTVNEGTGPYCVP